MRGRPGTLKLCLYSSVYALSSLFPAMVLVSMSAMSAHVRALLSTPLLVTVGKAFSLDISILPI